MIAVCFICIYPLLRIFSISLRPGDQLISTDLSLIPKGASFASYAGVLKSTNFLLWLWNSLIITVVTSFIGVSLASTAGYAFSRFKFPGNKLGLTLLLGTQMIPASMRPEVNKDPAIKKLLTKPQKLRVLLAQLRKVYPKTYAAANLTYGRLPRVNQYAVSFGYVEQDKSALSLVNGKGGANAMPTLPVTRMELAAEIPQLRIASAVPEFQAKPIPQIVITEGIGAYANTVAHTAPAVPENSSVMATADTTEKPGFFKKLFGGIFGKKETDDSSYSSDSGSSSSSSKESKYLKAKDSSSGDKTGTNFFNADSASGSSSSGASAGGGAGGGSGDVGGGSSSGGAFSGGGAVSAMEIICEAASSPLASSLPTYICASTSLCDSPPSETSAFTGSLSPARTSRSMRSETFLMLTCRRRQAVCPPI